MSRAPGVESGRPIPRSLAISADNLLDRTAFEAWLSTLRSVAVDAAQIRAKSFDDRSLFEALKAARSRLDPSTAVLANGRADLCLAAGCDGVHLPSSGLGAGIVRQLDTGQAARGNRMPLLIGRSTHQLDEVDRARAEGVDYVVFGPIFDTPSKRVYGPPLGLDALTAAVELGVPVLAIGGIGSESVASVMATGAHGIAAIRAFADPTEAAALIESLRSCLAPNER